MFPRSSTVMYWIVPAGNPLVNPKPARVDPADAGIPVEKITVLLTVSSTTTAQSTGTKVEVTALATSRRRNPLTPFTSIGDTVRL
jgi:hypothetical protein